MAFARFVSTLFLLTALPLVTLAAAPEPRIETKIKNIRELLAKAGLDRVADQTTPSPRPVRIAILDNGFLGHEKEIGRTLPSNTVYHAGPIAPPQPEDFHGLAMAQIVTAAITGGTSRLRIPTELHLYSAFGYSNLKAAIDAVAAGDFDIVLYSQVWEYGGNGDGRGFINQVIKPALDSGVIWINAAGNFGLTTYRTPIVKAEDGWARLPGPNSAVRLRCRPRGATTCNLRLVLSWNDFKDDVSAGTAKDLDLVLTDDTLRILRTSGLAQKVSGADGAPGTSLYPREIIQTEVPAGTYLARVKIRGGEFAVNDELRLTASGDFVEMLDATPGETVLNPADNPHVISVGASDSENSSVSRRLGKPELFFPSLIDLGDNERFKGSSNAAALAAGAAAFVRALNPRADRDAVIEALSSFGRDGGSSRGGSDGGRTAPENPEGSRQRLRPQGPGRGLPIASLGFATTGPGCFLPGTLPVTHRSHAALIRDGGVVVATTRGPKIVLQLDPLQVITGLRRVRADDLVVADRHGFTLAPRSAARLLPADSIEVVQMPAGTRLCGE